MVLTLYIEWFPEALVNASNSAEHLARKLYSHVTQGGGDLQDYIIELVQSGLGIKDASDDEIKLIVDTPQFSVYYFADMVSRRAQIGWSSHGHSAVDVNIYGSIGTEALHGNRENTEIGKFLREYLDVDVEAITEELLENSKSFGVLGDGQTAWTGRVPSEEDLQAVSRHYEHLYGKAP
jgi:alkaline phosphatase